MGARASLHNLTKNAPDLYSKINIPDVVPRWKRECKLSSRCCILELRRFTSPTTTPSAMHWLSDVILPFKVKKMCLTIYQPQSNGIVERCYRTLLYILQTVKQDAQGAQLKIPSYGQSTQMNSEEFELKL